MENQLIPDFVKCPKCGMSESFEIVTRKISSESIRIIRCSNTKCQTFLAVVPESQTDYKEPLNNLNFNIGTVNQNISLLNTNLTTLSKLLPAQNNVKPKFKKLEKLKYVVHFENFKK